MRRLLLAVACLSVTPAAAPGKGEPAFPDDFARQEGEPYSLIVAARCPSEAVAVAKELCFGGKPFSGRIEAKWDALMKTDGSEVLYALTSDGKFLQFYWVYIHRRRP